MERQCDSVLADDSPESVELRAFRDRLRADRALVAAYVRRKREIIAGVTGGIDYAHIKGEFVTRTLAE
ncbi:MAG TPA: GrpB family protein [Candidatus Binataceae bacterium]|nr:GrpB family protein [Candidatus Binataceae bacterium]